MKGIKWAVVLILANFVFSQAFGAEDFSISSLSKEKKRAAGEDYLFLTAVYKSRPKEVSDVEVKFYVLLKKTSEETLAVGSQSFSEVKKGKHKVIMVIKPPEESSDVKSYGRVKKMRVEVWYDEELVASKTKPQSSKRKMKKKKYRWWEQGDEENILEPGEDLLKLIKEI